MNNKDREHVGYFLSIVDQEYYNTNIRLLLDSIEDDKLTDIYNDYCDIASDTEEMISTIMSRAKQLWRADYPNDSDINILLKRSYTSGNYYNKACISLTKEFDDNEDYDSFDIIIGMGKW